MTRHQYWAIICIIIIVFWGGIYKAVAQVTLRDMLPPSPNWQSYQLPKCSETVCELTGLGGLLHVWLNHVDENADKIFVVINTCASACWFAVKRAKQMVVL